MSGAAAQYEERGGILRLHNSCSSDTMNANANTTTAGGAQSNPTSSSATSTTEHDFRFPRRPADKPQEGAALKSKSLTSQYSTTRSSTQPSGVSALDKLDLSAVD